jgi:hypothetical protein
MPFLLTVDVFNMIQTVPGLLNLLRKAGRLQARAIQLKSRTAELQNTSGRRVHDPRVRIDRY